MRSRLLHRSQILLKTTRKERRPPRQDSKLLLPLLAVEVFFRT